MFFVNLLASADRFSFAALNFSSNPPGFGTLFIGRYFDFRWRSSTIALLILVMCSDSWEMWKMSSLSEKSSMTGK